MTSLLRLLTWHLGSQVVGADSDVRGVDSSGGSVGHSVGKSSTSNNTGTIGVGDAVGMSAVAVDSSETIAGVGEAGIQESWVGIGISIGITLLASTGDGHVPGVHAGGGLAAVGVAEAVEAVVAEAVVTGIAEAVAVAVVAVVGIGISIGGDSSHKGGEEDKELHDDDAALICDFDGGMDNSNEPVIKTDSNKGYSTGAGNTAYSTGMGGGR